jgi:hypothetical protein
MARTRYIKPDFFDDTSIAELTMEARLLYIGLWTMMDRRGICLLEPRLIKKTIFGYDDKISVVKVSHLLAELIDGGFVRKVQYDEKEWLFCPTFGRHQKFHVDEKPKYLIPEAILHDAASAPGSHPADPPPTMINATAKRAGTGTGTGTGTQSGANAPGPNGPPSPAWLAETWNQHSGSLKKLQEPQSLSSDRERAARARLKEKPEPRMWVEVISRMAKNSFCLGKKNSEKHKHWKADFDWLIRPGTVDRFLEGKYDDANAPSAKPNPFQAELAEEMAKISGGVA